MTTETAYCNGFFLNICDSHTDYSNNCYELANIDINSDDKVLKAFEDYADVLVEEELVSLTILNDSILEKVKKSLDEFGKLSNVEKRAFVRGLCEYSHLILMGDEVLVSTPVSTPSAKSKPLICFAKAGIASRMAVIAYSGNAVSRLVR